jgi:hypothetical protein
MRGRISWGPLIGIGLSTVVLATAVASLPPASSPTSAVPAPPRSTADAAAVRALDVSESVPLDQAIDRILHCRGEAVATRSDCVGVVYVWSPLMPLSRTGIEEIRRGTEKLGIGLAVVEATELESRVEALLQSTAADPAGPATLSPEDRLAAEMLGAGATVHYPSLLVHRSGRLVGSAILGYKTDEAYRTLLRERLQGLQGGAASMPPPAAAGQFSSADSVEWYKDFLVAGRPGAYFRAVPGRQTVAYEADRTVYLLGLDDGSTAVAPGFIDFVPTPDGRLFVTPSQRPRGLAFYAAEEVFRAARQGTSASVEPIYVDSRLRDQYPSVGILSAGPEAAGGATAYRVLTSWFDRIVVRDYEVRTDPATDRMSVRPLGEPRAECPRVSTPILSPGGRELAGRDETSATTKIFRLDEPTGCREVEDLRLQTGKVAWAPDAGEIAFAIPRGSVRGREGRAESAAGIFVYDRTTKRVARVEGSETANRLAFPDYVGRDSLVFLISPESGSGRSVFRLVCCLE